MPQWYLISPGKVAQMTRELCDLLIQACANNRPDLLPLYGRRWFSGDVVGDAGDAFYFVDNAV